MRMPTPGSVPSSRSSLVVNLPWEGPRRATMCTSRTPLAPSAPSAACGMSVGASSAAPRASIRVTSTATFPAPITTAERTPVRSKAPGSVSGWPLYQDTNAVAEWTPARSSPGIPSSRSRAAPTQYTTAW